MLKIVRQACGSRSCGSLYALLPEVPTKVLPLFITSEKMTTAVPFEKDCPTSDEHAGNEYALFAFPPLNCETKNRKSGKNQDIAVVAAQHAAVVAVIGRQSLRWPNISYCAEGGWLMYLGSSREGNAKGKFRLFGILIRPKLLCD